jgi:hypothetical protein
MTIKAILREMRDIADDEWDALMMLTKEKPMTTDVDLDGLSYELWAMAQMGPKEGIEDAARRLSETLQEVFRNKDAEIERLKRIAGIFNTVAEERSAALREVDRLKSETVSRAWASILAARIQEGLADIERLNREVRYLRHYGNKDCTHMADQAMANGELEDK